MARIRIIRDEVIHTGKYIALVNRHFTGSHNKPGIWETVERTSVAKHIVAIAPITANHEIILTKIYRVPLRKYVIELCIGLKDRPRESDAQTARRELLEETGYAVKKVKKIALGPSNPGLINDDIALFLGFDAKLAQKPETENSEDIEALKIPLARILSFLAHPPRGVVVDIKIYIALFFLAHQGYKIG